MKKASYTSFILVILSPFIALPANSQIQEPTINYERFERCMHRIILYQSPRRYNFNGHGFVCKGLSGHRTTNGVTRFSGQLSHHLSLRPDDQVNWSFGIDREGAIVDLEIEMQRGGVGRVIRWPIRQAAKRLPRRVWRDVASDFDSAVRIISNRAGWQIDGTWESTARQIVALIAANMSESRASLNASRRNLPTTPEYHYEIQPVANRTLDVLRGRTARECRLQCSNHSGCEIWSLGREESEYRTAGNLQCRLYTRSQVSAFRPQMRAISGAIQ